MMIVVDTIYYAFKHSGTKISRQIHWNKVGCTCVCVRNTMEFGLWMVSHFLVIYEWVPMFFGRCNLENSKHFQVQKSNLEISPDLYFETNSSEQNWEHMCVYVRVCLLVCVYVKYEGVWVVDGMLYF